MSDDGGGDEYSVEKILDKRTNGYGEVEYLIKWEGYSVNESTWENASGANCPDLIEEFERKRKEEAAAAAKRRSLDTKPVVKKEKVNEPQAKIKEIIGMSYKGGEKMFVVRYTDDTATLVPCKEIHEKFPHEAVKFYDKSVRAPIDRSSM